MRIGILEPEEFSKKSLLKLEKLGDIISFDDGIKDVNILFVRLGHFIDENILDKTPSLIALCSPTTGLNHINLKEIKKRNIHLISLKGHVEFLDSINATPEHTIGLIIALLRNYKNAFSSTSRMECVGREINGMKFGIIGMGRVGKKVSQHLLSFGANLSYFDIRKINSDLVSHSTLKSLICNNEFIIICASYENEIIITSELIDLMNNKYLVNTSRGELIDENYLAIKAQEGHFSGIALDVISNELLKSNNRNLLLKSGVLLTPHIAGATYESMRKTEDFIVELLLSYLTNKMNTSAILCH